VEPGEGALLSLPHHLLLVFPTAVAPVGFQALSRLVWAPEAGSWQAQGGWAGSPTSGLAFHALAWVAIYSPRRSLGVGPFWTTEAWCLLWPSRTSGPKPQAWKGRLELWSFRGPRLNPEFRRPLIPSADTPCLQQSWRCRSSVASALWATSTSWEFTGEDRGKGLFLGCLLLPPEGQASLERFCCLTGQGWGLKISWETREGPACFVQRLSGCVVWALVKYARKTPPSTFLPYRLTMVSSCERRLKYLQTRNHIFGLRQPYEWG
jgi:hypothetical protein